MDIIATFTGFTGSGKSVAATYTVDAPPGGWGAGNNGINSVFLNDGEVSDTLGNVVTGRTIGGWDVGVDSTPPQASSFPWDVTNPTADQSIFVSYEDEFPWVRVSTLDNNDIRVIGPNGFNQPASFIPDERQVDDQFVLAAYRLAAPAGGWTTLNNGTYSIVIQPGEVTDLAGNAVPTGTIGTFKVTVGARPRAGRRRRSCRSSPTPRGSRSTA